MIYLDNAATTFPKPPRVAEAVTRCLAECGGNPGRGTHGAALAAAGQIYSCREALSAFVDKTQETVTGDVTLKLYKGNMINAGVTSPFSLYDEEIATFDEDNVYDQKDSAGFINLFGLPCKVRAMINKKNK